jgi:hypothetical protein
VARNGWVHDQGQIGIERERQHRARDAASKALSYIGGGEANIGRCEEPPRGRFLLMGSRHSAGLACLLLAHSISGLIKKAAIEG